MNKHDLEERLINIAVLIVKIIGTMPKIKVANHVAGQLLRSEISPALNYGEAKVENLAKI